MEVSKKTIQERYKQWNDSLYYRYIKRFNENTTIWDGVLFPEEYAKAGFKIMILNREAYDPEPNNPYDLCEAIRERIKTNCRPE